MSKRSQIDRSTMFEPDDDDRTSLDEFADAIYGEPPAPELDTGRLVARPLALADIWPDVRQPRRAIPASIRLHWNGQPAHIPQLIDEWHAIASSLAGIEIDRAAILTGRGDGLDTDGLPPLAEAYISLLRLAQDIASVGLSNPINVVQQGTRRLIESGERRYLAYWILHMHHGGTAYARIPAVISDGRDFVWRQASENTARRSLNAIGMARQLALLIMASRDGVDGIKYNTYEELVVQGGCDRRFYAQVANGNIHRIPKGLGERIQAAMGLSEKRLSDYRSLLKLTGDDAVNDALWIRADVEDWPDIILREIRTLPLGKVSDIISRDDWSLKDFRAAIEDYKTSETLPAGNLSESPAPQMQGTSAGVTRPDGTPVTPQEFDAAKARFQVGEVVLDVMAGRAELVRVKSVIGHGGLYEVINLKTGAEVLRTVNELKRYPGTPDELAAAVAAIENADAAQFRTGDKVTVAGKLGEVRFTRADGMIGVYTYANGGSTHYYRPGALTRADHLTPAAVDERIASEQADPAPSTPPARREAATAGDFLTGDYVYIGNRPVAGLVGEVEAVNPSKNSVAVRMLMSGRVNNYSPRMLKICEDQDVIRLAQAAAREPFTDPAVSTAPTLNAGDVVRVAGTATSFTGAYGQVVGGLTERDEVYIHIFATAKTYLYSPDELELITDPEVIATVRAKALAIDSDKTPSAPQPDDAGGDLLLTEEPHFSIFAHLAQLAQHAGEPDLARMLRKFQGLTRAQAGEMAAEGSLDYDADTLMFGLRDAMEIWLGHVDTYLGWLVEEFAGGDE